MIEKKSGKALFLVGLSTLALTSYASDFKTESTWICENQSPTDLKVLVKTTNDGRRAVIRLDLEQLDYAKSAKHPAFKLNTLHYWSCQGDQCSPAFGVLSLKHPLDLEGSRLLEGVLKDGRSKSGIPVSSVVPPIGCPA